jgi:ectoine hydroxylase-related dioxygenase (phytanoyl-CoA dioxygenase family)
VKLIDKFQDEGAILLSRAIDENGFKQVDNILKDQWRQFDIVNPYTESCAKFAMDNPSIVTEIYDEVADLHECREIARLPQIKSVVKSLLGENAKIYSKVPLRIDVPLVTKELAVWHQDDFYVKGAPNEITAWIPLQDTPMHAGALSIMKKSHHYGRLAHDFSWGKKSMPVGVYDLPINIIEMQRGDVLMFNSLLLHTSNINFSKFIRYSIQIRFTSARLGKPSDSMGGLHDF